MSNEKRETVADIVAEMIDVARANGFGRSHWADRIEAAVNRQYRTLEVQNEKLKQRLSMCEKINEQQDMDYGALKEENARLRAALKPVLEADCQLDDYQTKDAYLEAMVIAVSNAQRIYDEGARNERQEGTACADRN